MSLLHTRPALRFAAATLLMASPALASSDEAWSEFRAAVLTGCTAKVDKSDTDTATVEVNPFGSEKYGAALVTIGHQDGTAERMICIYDKQSKTVELTGPFGAN